MGDYATEVRKTADNRTLVYRRRFDWGREGQVLIPAANYKAVKQVFDFVQDQDNYTLTLKQAAQ